MAEKEIIKAASESECIVFPSRCEDLQPALDKSRGMYDKKMGDSKMNRRMKMFPGSIVVSPIFLSFVFPSARFEQWVVGEARAGVLSVRKIRQTPTES
jgi:hypothetical protein